ncbi:barstar family protein [Xenorhabdus yunnanensis]|uniref:barstar family protein n=1 Tax=Xenorhabdus yunnanensis TaxID=3025878 RepID=UPI00359C113A
MSLPPPGRSSAYRAITAVVLGRNLDALDDCLIDISHRNVKVLFKNSIQMLKSLNTEKNIRKTMCLL